MNVSIFAAFYNLHIGSKFIEYRWEKKNQMKKTQSNFTITSLSVYTRYCLCSQYLHLLNKEITCVATVISVALTNNVLTHGHQPSWKYIFNYLCNVLVKKKKIYTLTQTHTFLLQIMYKNATFSNNNSGLSLFRGKRQDYFKCRMYIRVGLLL